MKRMPSQADNFIPPPARQREGAVVGLEDRPRTRDGFAPKTTEKFADDASSWPRPLESINVPAESRNGSSGPLVPVPVPNEMTGYIAGTSSIRQLSERLAPAAAVENSCRLA